MIAVEADLRAESGGLRLRIDGSGSVLTCHLDGNPADFFATLRRSRHLLSAIRAAVPVLLRTGLRLDVRAGNIRIGSAGTGVRQNAPARFLKLPAVHLGS